jgi:gamma-glutamyltranspeptidase / glutathione hydrolase
MNPDRPSAALRLLTPLFAGLWLAACQTATQRDAPPASGPPRVEARPAGGVAAAHPLAVDAGIRILERGGSAVDAAVAVQAMLSLVEPQSSGIGGGAFLLHYEAATGNVTAFDGRETAPAGATPDMYLDASGEPLPWREVVVTGRATGVPGVMPMLGAAHARHGRLPWSALFDDVAESATEGFNVPQRLARFVSSPWPQASGTDARALFARADGSPVQAGDLLTNPAFAGSLARLAEQGPRALLEPPLSTAIIERTRAEPLPGTLVQADFDAYAPRVTEPICGPFRVYLVCVPPPPSSGVALLQMLAILDRTDIASRGPDDPQAWFLFAEASRLMYADRNQFVADPAFGDVPVAGLLEPDYVATRAALIGERAGPPPLAGQPAGARRGADATAEPAGTSHFVVVDAAGNVVTMTTSVESLFGSGRAVGGFFLNNQLTDFSFRPVENGLPVANSVAGGKRPRSSMSPVVVLDSEGRLVAALGSPGGSAILAYNAKALVGLLAWKLPLQAAIELPNLIASGESYFGEAAKFAPGVLEGLAARGIEVKPGRGEESGLHGVHLHASGALEGAADPRREGTWREVAAPR